MKRLLARLTNRMLGKIKGSKPTMPQEKNWRALLLGEDEKQCPAAEFRKLSEELRLAGEFSKAEHICSRGVEIHPHNLRLALIHARISDSLANPELRLTRWRRVIDLGGDKAPWQAFKRLAKILHALGEFSEAEQICSRGIEIYPENLWLARLHSKISASLPEPVRTHDYQRSIESAHQSLSKVPETRVSEVLDQLQIGSARGTSGTGMRYMAIGNCQCVTFANLAAKMLPGDRVEHCELHSLDEDLRAKIGEYDLAFVQPHFYDRLPENLRKSTAVALFPRCTFSGFHPDIIHNLTFEGKRYVSPASHHSALVFGGWFHGLSEDETECLFHDPKTFDSLQFARYFEMARIAFFNEWELCGLDAGPYFDKWMASKSPFMLTTNHPSLDVMLDATRAVLVSRGLLPADTFELPHHHLRELAIMPVYPFIAARYGMDGSLEFIRNNDGRPSRSLDLRTFIDICFANYRKCDKTKFSVTRATNDTYRRFFEDFLARKKSSRSRHPYRDIPPHQNWRKSFANKPVVDVDPVVDFKFKIRPTDKVATAGSCFAQHLARALVHSGLNYYAPERGDPALGYGHYSARYGNIYTTLQLSQMLDRAYGKFIPSDTAWKTAEGTFADPFRPEIPLTQKSAIADIEAERERHFVYVREMVECMDYFVFTLGLTECWCSRVDGAVFPIAPGVAAGEMDFEKYTFANLDEMETYQHLRDSIGKIRAINSSVKVILTVSPVPLMATFEPRHVLSSTTYSKAVLRVAAERACKEIQNVAYFPSFEIITGNYNRGAYFDDDLRSVRQEGVDHVMRLFLKHATTIDGGESEEQRQIREDNDILCAEEMLDA